VTAPDVPALRIRGLRFGYPDGPPLLSVPFLEIGSGERVFLAGPSGSGKSTLLSLVAGVLAPREGSLELLGVDLAALSAARRDRLRGEQVGYVFQQFNLIPYLSVLDNVLLPLRFAPARRDRVPDDAVSEAQRLLEALGLDAATLSDRKPTALSIGQQQRVAVARALVGRPALLIADEPTSALDADARERFLELLRAECARSRTALLFVSHDTALAPLFDRQLSMHEFAA
jgi:putative ABC transport system ATP-binding protein